MLTRSKAKLIKNKQAEFKQVLVMENSNEMSNNSSVDVEVEVNNQLGDDNIFDELTMNNERENFDLEARGPKNRQTESTKDTDMYAMFQQIIQKINEGTQNTEKQLKENTQNMKILIEENTQQMRNSMKLLKEDITQQLREHKQEIAQQFIDIRRENHESLAQMRGETKKLIHDEIQVVRVNMYEQIDRIDETIKIQNSNITQEIKTITKKMINGQKRQEEQISAHKEDINIKVSEIKENNNIKIQELEHKLVNNSEEVDGKLNRIQEDVRRRINQGGSNATTNLLTNEHLKNITFTGESEYPMEFLQELSEIQQEYYSPDNIKWLTRHFEGEAAIWWKLIKNKISTFKEFADAFINKYWNQLIQEEVRDRLEYGKYRRDEGLTMIQYMERRVLENRQLLPPITDQHLIRKLARHFYHGIEVAIVTRGVSTITEFAQVLHEFTNIQGRHKSTTPEPVTQMTYVKPENTNRAGIPNRFWQKGNSNNKERSEQHQGTNGENVKRFYDHKLQTIAGPSGTQTSGENTNGVSKN